VLWCWAETMLGPVNSTKVAEVRIGMLKVQLYGVMLATITVLLCMAIAVIRGYKTSQDSRWDYLIALALAAPFLVVHEPLHGLAAVLYGRVRWRDLRFGVSWRAGGATCHIKVPITVKAARITGIAPLILSAPITLVILLMYPSRVTAMLAAFTLVVCTGDMLMLHRLQPYDAHLLFVDHPSECGFDIYQPERAGPAAPDSHPGKGTD